MGHTKKKEAKNIDIQDESISFPTWRIVILFYPSFALMCSVIRQRYGDRSRPTCSLDFKLTGIQIATKRMPGTTNEEHRNYAVQFLLSEMMPVSPNLNYNLQK